MYNLIDKLNDWTFNQWVSQKDGTLADICWRFLSDLTEYALHHCKQPE